MPTRSTKRGADRTSLSGDYDVIVCGASFAGLTVARQLTGSGARVLLLDRYDVGERQTSACGIPTAWLKAMGLMDSFRQEFGSLVVHTPHGTSRYDLPWTFSTFDYRTLCQILFEGCDAEFETAKVEGRGESPEIVRTDRGEVSAPLVVDALGWRRVLASAGYQPPEAPLSRGLEVHPPGPGDDLEIWIDRRYVPAGYGWSFPAGEETRVGVGSFDPRFHVKDTTVLLADDLEARRGPLPGQLDPPQAPARRRGPGLLLRRLGRPLPAAHGGGHPDRLLLRDRAWRGAQKRGRGAKDARRCPSRLRELQRLARVEVQLDAPRAAHRAALPARAQRGLVAAAGRKRFVDWSFGHYLEIAHPRFAEEHVRLGEGDRVPVAA